MKPSLPLAPLFAGIASAAAIIHHAANIPHGWTLLQDLIQPTQRIQFSIALDRPHMSDLRSKIGANKPHLSLDEVKALRAPDPNHVKLVLQWLNENGVDDYDVSDEWIHVRTDVSKAEPLLDMRLQNFVFQDRAPMLRTLKYSIPDSLRDIIKFVNPVNNFMKPHHKVMISAESEDMSVQSESASDAVPCLGSVTPGCIRDLYNITYDTKQESDVRIGVAGFLDEFTNYADTDVFLRGQAPDLAGRNFTVESINQGGDDQSNPGVEAALDIEYVMALAAPAKAIYYSTSGRGVKLDDDGKPISGAGDDNEPYLELLEYLLRKPSSQLPHVLSISYGDDELSVPANYAEHVCGTFGLLTARGISILGSSGDGGAAGGQHSKCLTNDGANRQVAMGTFPSTCEWITSVGATASGREPPSAAIFSSGGFSQRYERPPWQNGPGLVDDYVGELNGHLQGKYDANMRAFPDISVVGTRFAIVVGGQRMLVDGTSASTPTLASMIALVTDARLKMGKKPLGWLNELIYSEEVRAVLQDVTNGTTQSCTWNGETPGGWPALKGWDAATGVGVPKNFEKFMQVLVDLY
ncbi:Tripeptidyl-peptidase SED2 [Escovopsis weberi]|uniref:tripeptidyl-peptidase II n=1 Tax=Escovopsis weberi TaxID=150374 RepID=A0A0M9VX75_ESCWE|nr:Tripeptidyl-peptidase SED2 [Escovopsis weberi]